jgi:hypothetical protein
VSHRAHHPSPVKGCFGCKVSGLGFDGGHTTRSTTDEHHATVTEHRSGRQDVLLRAPGIHIRTTQTEER